MVIKINEDRVFSEGAFLDRFNRQIKIPGWGEKEQKKIFNKKVLVLGDDVMGEMVLAGLASFGARNLFYCDYNDSSSEKSYFSRVKESGTRLERIVKTSAKINPHSKILGYKTPFTKFPLRMEKFNPEIIIDATNNPESKEMVLDHIESNKKVKLISGISNQNACSVSSYDFFSGNYKEILNPKIEAEMYLQGGFTSNVAAGLIIEEFRKSIFNLSEEDKNSEETIYYNLESYKKNSPNRDFAFRDFNKDAKVLVAGCGGIGNYAALSLAQEGFRNMSFLDMDNIEDTNLNRQMFFYDDIGDKKSISLSRKLRGVFDINPRIFVGELNEKADKFFEKNNYDLVLGCFDNVDARMFLNENALKHKIPYIDGGTNYESGQIRAYIPGHTACIKCKKSLSIEEKVEDNSCDNALPSVISPNMIVGSSMVGEAMAYLSGDYKENILSYDTKSKKKISSYDERNRLKEECFCEGEKNE